MEPPATLHACHSSTEPAPACTLVIFGASGDLTKRLLIPALYNLAASKLLSDELTILGLDRVAMAEGDWAASLAEFMESSTRDPNAEFHANRIDARVWGWIRGRLSYLQADFQDPATYTKLAGSLQGSVVFYLAVAARFSGPIVNQLGAAGLLKEGDRQFRRVVIEKPFGSDLHSAEGLNREILAVAKEQQLYRIDHFLGKEAVQSILAIRFANSIYEPVWNSNYIDHVQITAAETIGVEERGAFYEPTGALRDMVPNHLFQLLCMTAMEPPNSLAPEAVRTEKAKLIEAVRPVEARDAVRGQYVSGHVLGHDARGYREEPHVAQDSRTETYIALRLSIDNGRWNGVPFYLRTGKRLAARQTEIVIQFKRSPHRLFREAAGATSCNVMRLLIDPDQRTQTQFNVKAPGPLMQLACATTEFRFADRFPEQSRVGYETPIYDCLIGDATLFQRADSIEAAWTAVQRLIEAWATGKPEPYIAGGEGPSSADALLARDGRSWQPLGSS